MTMITMKKLIAIVLIAIMLITITMPVFGASNTSKVTSLLKKIKNSMEKAIKLVNQILSAGSNPVTGSSMSSIAKSCKKVLRENEFYYGSKTYNFQEAPPSSSTGTKKIDCSGYVSWVIYEYAKQKGNTTVQQAFKNNKSSSEIKTYLNNNTTYFTNLGKLNQLSASDLKAGDIIVKSGHVEIFGKYDSSVTNKYRCYNAGSTDQILAGKDTGELTGGACNSGSSNYTVYRVKF